MVMRQEISQQTNLELTNNAHLNTHTEDTGALSWLIGDMVSHVLGDGLPPRPRQDWRNSDILSCMLEEFLKDMGEVPSLVAGQSRTKGTGEAVDAKPKFVVPYSPNDDYAKFKPLPFIDGLRKAQALDLPDPDNPDTAVRTPRGKSTSMFFRLCWRAPLILIQSAKAFIRFAQAPRCPCRSAVAEFPSAGFAGRGRTPPTACTAV